MKMKGMLFKEMSDKGVKRYSISLMSREIQGETRVFFFLPIRLEWWYGYKEGAYLDTFGGNINLYSRFGGGFGGKV